MDLVQTLDRINTSAFANDEERSEAVEAAYALVSRLETPWEFIMRNCMIQPAVGAALKIGKDLDLYQKWHDRGTLR
ncbi:hypothetical protein NPX13_g6973 [Xylaria arbuscula]|uniref:Uncharacterized protein n=1 Tax=Xylaria arbuscula TaxID=114810 RepID=A0A9W8TL87_9PEZI|nr:hypothetical protein NPX13_g6973 [Xylaria arbuscula]